MKLTKAQDAVMDSLRKGEVLFFNHDRGRFEIGTGSGFDTVAVSRSVVRALNKEGLLQGMGECGTLVTPKGWLYNRERFDARQVPEDTNAST